MLLEAQEDPNNWLMAPGNYTGNRFSKLGQINTSNVSNLVPKWIFSLGTLDAQNTTPVVHNGVMFVTASHGKTYALNGENGQEIWRYSHQLPEGVAGKMCCDIGNRGVALYNDKVFVATPDAHVVALDKNDGSVKWDVTVGDWEKAYTMTVAPLVVKGNVITGMSGAEYPTRLWIDALDAETGEQVWRTYTIPGPGEPGHEEVQPREGDHVHRNLTEIAVQLPGETKAASDPGHRRAHQVVEVPVSGSGQLKGTEANVVQRFVIHHEHLVRILHQLVERKHSVVRLHHRVRHLRRRNHRECAHDPVRVLLADLGDQQRAHPAPGAPSKRVAELEPLQAIAALRLLPHHVQHRIDQFRALGVVPLRPVVPRPGRKSPPSSRGRRNIAPWKARCHERPP